MRYAFFQGCNIPVRIEQYAQSTQAVMSLFGVELKEIRDFNCCGYPVRNVDEKAYILPSVRNLALAEQADLDILVICNCCFQSLKKAQNVLAKNPSLAKELNNVLAKEGLSYQGKAVVKHYLTVLHEDIGVKTIKARLVHRFTELRSAVLHGCHLLRPREVTGFDNSFVPTITDNLMQLAGAESIDWLGKMECCGAPLAGINDEVSHRLLTEKIEGAQSAGADYITPICSYCYLQFDTTQVNINREKLEAKPLPVLLYPQLLGLCLGLDPEQLGLAKNTTIAPDHIAALQSLLGPPEEEKKKKAKARAAA